MSSTASARPHSRPTTNFTPSCNYLLEDCIEDADTATAIRLFLMRNTVGWHRSSYVTTITGLSKILGRSRTQVKRKLAKLVAKGCVIRKNLEGGGFELTLADSARKPSNETQPKEPKKGGGKLTSGYVDNSRSEEPRQRGGGAKKTHRVGLKRPKGGGRKRPTDPKPNPRNHSEADSPKQRTNKETFKENLVLKHRSTPATTVENSPEEGSESRLNRTVLVEQMCGGRKATTPPFKSRSKIPGEPSLEDLIGGSNHEPSRFRSLRGFPVREEVRFERRMAYEAFEGQWERILGKDKSHQALQTYVWHSFTAEEAKYLIHECRRARNLYGYARSIVIAMEEGLSAPSRQSGGYRPNAKKPFSV